MKLFALTACLVILLPARSEVKFRLVNGDEPNSGRLEVLYNGTWGTICDDAFDALDAKVACRYFGYGTGIAKERAYYGEGTGPIWMDELQCSGRETSLEDCNFRGWGRGDCGHNEHVGVHCSLVQFRLTNGPCRNSGRIEVLYNNTWGTVCDDSFGQEEADVICRYFGFSGGAPKTHAFYNEGSGSIWMDNLGCSGSETSVEYCSFNGWGKHNCHHGEDAGVDCFNEDNCPEIGAPIHGSLSSRSVDYGIYVTVSCDTNYTLVGKSILQCVSSSWSGTVGTCEEDCPELEAPTHGSLSSSSVGHGTYVTVSCNTNYTLTGQTILQCKSGSWSETVGTCEADCLELRAPINGSLSSRAVNHGTYVIVSCDTNYTLVGVRNLVCFSGSWLETVGTCEEDCPRLGAPVHGSLSTSALGHGTYVTVSCDTNYTLVGKSILQCVSGLWSETVGTCEADCPELEAPTHGSLSSSSVGHGTYVPVSCNTNYTLTGQTILHCESGLWSDTVGTCEADCPGLSAPIHGSLSSNFRVHGTNITLLCDTSYTLVGKSILQCISGSWSETFGTCETDPVSTSKNEKQTTTIIVGATLGGLVLALGGMIIAQGLYFKRKTKPERRTVFEGLDEMQMTPDDTGNTYSDLRSTIKEHRQDNERPAFSGGLTAVSNEVYMQDQDMQNNCDDYKNPNMSGKKPRDANLTANCPGGAEAGANEMDAQETYENFGFSTRGQEDYEAMDNLGNDENHVYTLYMDQEETYTNLPFQ